MKLLKSLLIALPILTPQLTQACTVCFGGSNGDLQRGFFWGIVLLGLLPFGLLGFFVSYLFINQKKQ